MPPAPDDLSTEHLLDLLKWYGEMGVDAVLDEAPHDRFVEGAAGVGAPAVSEEAQPAKPALRPARPLPAPPASAELLSSPADVVVQSAREIAAGASTLEDLRGALEQFDGCTLKRTASRLVFSDGSPQARVMLVGEAPGADEDRTGVPFVGRGGQLLDRMLGAIGLDRTSVYIANVVPWRPPGNRTPTPQEVAICHPFITRQIELVGPDILVLLGAAAMQALLGTKDGITKARGRWMEFTSGQRRIRAIPMLHPAYLLRQPAHKGFAWRDWRALRKELDRPDNSERQ
jgi:uracil-DNA glycosylase